MKIVIIGGVAGGAGAAAAARRANESAEIELFEAGSYISFANCGLPYYVSGEIAERKKLLVTSPELFTKRFRVNLHLQTTVTAIERDRKIIKTRTALGETGETSYDRLVIATGAAAIRPPAAGLDHKRVVECRRIEDVDRIIELLQSGGKKRVLVVGGGFIGLEIAEALTLRGAEVVLIDLGKQLLPPYDVEIAAAALDEFKRQRVSVKLGVKVEKFDHGEAESRADLSDGSSITFDFAVLAIGVVPEISLAKAAGLAIGATGGLLVDEYQRTSDPDIFAAGDVTELFYWPTQSRMRLALAGPANKQARVAGANAAGAMPVLKSGGAAGTSIVRVFDLALGMTGLSEKAARARGIEFTVSYTQNTQHAGYFPGAQPVFIKLIFEKESGRLLGGQAFGKEGVDKRIDVLATAIQGRFSVHDLAELDLVYAPPYGSAKDPVIIAGMAASNIVKKRSSSISPAELHALIAAGNTPLVLDVRSETENAAGSIEGAVNIPIDSLRDRLSELPKERAVVVHCAVGYRGYVAERILKQNGVTDVRNLSGGYRAWSLFSSAWESIPLPHPL